MEKLSVTSEQEAFIEDLRSEISASLVGPYGTVRTRDAVQFLIDQYEEHGVEPSEIEGAVPRADADSGADSSEVTVDDGSADEPADEPTDEPADEPTDDEAATDVDTSDVDTEADADGGGDTDDASQDDTQGAANDTDRLNQMMSLLDTHDDKWDEATSSDARYVVHLPDGTDEHVQTKDDVKALLFKNY